MPREVDELQNHELIVYGEEAPPTIANVNWLINLGKRRGKRFRPVLKVNNIYGLLLAVESGLGIGSLPDYIVQGHNKLMKVLPDVEGPSTDTYFVYPEELRNSNRIAVFRDFLVRAVAEWRF